MSSIDAIINRQFLRWELEKSRRDETDTAPHPAPERIVTISRQTGSRGSYFASRLAQRLGYQRLHREAIDAIVNSSGYLKRMVASLDEHFRSRLELLAESVITGKSVDHDDYFHHLCQAVLSMSRLGGVVLVGRGGSFILGPRRGFHLRCVCPMEERVNNIVKYRRVSEREARREIEHSDSERTEFFQKLFRADIDDPQHYDLVINSRYMDVEELVDTAVVAIDAKMEKLAHLDNDRG